MALTLAQIDALKQRYPSYNIVDAVEAPSEAGGGIWAVSADGGVHALDGARYMGSYWDDRYVAAVDRNDPNRQFSHIEVNNATGAYTIVSKTRERYNFWDPGKTSDTTEGGPGSTAGTGGAKSGEAAPKYDPSAALKGALKEVGLGELYDAAWEYYNGPGGSDINAVLAYLPTTDAYKNRFPGIPADWKPSQYLQYEQEVQRHLSVLPPNFAEQKDIGDFLANEWSADEVGQAVQLAQQAVLSMPAEDRAFLAEMGVNTSDLTAYYLDPDKKGGGILARKLATGRAQLGGAVARAGMDLTAGEATGLYDTGVSADEAAARAAAFAPGGQLNPLLAETLDESTDLGRQTAVDYLGGPGSAKGTAATGSLEQRKRARQARFEGGGGAAGFGRPGGGLGTA